MAKLTDTQLIVLSAAAARDDGIAVVPAQVNRAAASKVGAGLVSRKLMREARAKPGMPVWRQEVDGRPISLIITRAGRDAIGVEEDARAEARSPGNEPLSERDAPADEKRSRDASNGGATSPRAGTKQALVIGVDEAGKVFNRKLPRDKVLGFLGSLPPCEVAIEACSSSNHWGREIGRLGHRVRLISPNYVKPFVKRGKSDAHDARAICEAASRPDMRFVRVKTEEQQAALMQHTSRQLLVDQRAAVANSLRGH
jgi:hypothetical protein